MSGLSIEYGPTAPRYSGELRSAPNKHGEISVLEIQNAVLGVGGDYLSTHITLDWSAPDGSIAMTEGLDFAGQRARENFGQLHPYVPWDALTREYRRKLREAELPGAEEFE